MHFTKAVTVFISSELASSVVDALMVISPGRHTSIEAIFVRINGSSSC